MVGFGLLTWNLSSLLSNRCDIEHWDHETGVMICRIYKSLETFSVTGMYVNHGSQRLECRYSKANCATGSSQLLLSSWISAHCAPKPVSVFTIRWGWEILRDLCTCGPSPHRTTSQLQCLTFGMDTANHRSRFPSVRTESRGRLRLKTLGMRHPVSRPHMVVLLRERSTGTLIMGHEMWIGACVE